ncbi:DEAD/DEAH box helicase [Canibacter sp. lx-72]|uniref:DEAD/DEAH box helicase n=1 Tax=Canibacter zhuwentaonis TaxID=2837491 RepID=UPI001BDC8948|nr:DEAD/DEAH box helicase [Canibacter zhuwentaonis]MBT1018291.1 DEAD/DEAH box helicase [Canibacter zhuwentaonis]
MSRSPKRGFKTPKNYAPKKGKKSKHGNRGHDQDFREGFKNSRNQQGFGVGGGEDFVPRHSTYSRKSGARVHIFDDGAARDFRGDRKNFKQHDRDFGRGDRAERGGSVRFERDASEVRFERGDKRDRFERGAGGGRFDRSDRRGGFNHTGRGGDRFDRGNRYDGAERGERAPRAEGAARGFDCGGGRFDRGDRRDRFERAGRGGDRFERRGGDRFTGRGERADRGAKRGYDSRAEGFSSQGGYTPREDTVLDKLEAQITSAADVAELTFADLGLGERLCTELHKMGATAPFAIQAATIPDVLSGSDVLGRGRTGSGKTIAFGASLVERLLRLKAEGAFEVDPPQPKRERGRRRNETPGRAPKALIMAPTRELALQIDRTVQPLARAVGLFTTQLVGGAPIERQKLALRRGIDIAIGTPGRIEDLIERGELHTGQVVIAVLDEADHMAELGFIEPVQRIWRSLAPGAQKLLFSATLDSQVAKVVKEFLVEPAVHEVADAQQGNTDHHVLVVMREDKNEVLTELITGAQGPTIMFTRTRAYAETLSEMCEDAGISAVDLHGNLNQAKRERNLKRFTQGKAQVLVATDVAARGIHVDDVALVVQADPPDDYKSYLHRAGRTGRAGNDGVVVTVIPRNRQKRTRQLFDNAQLKPVYFGNFEPGAAQPWN